MGKSAARVVAGLALIAGVAGSASARTPRRHHASDAGRHATTRPSAQIQGPYPGVVPGAPNPPVRPVEPGTTPPTVTWPGFQMTQGGSRVFLEITAPVTYQVSRKGRTVTVVLKGARLHLRNNMRPLDTRYFQTPVLSAQARQAGGDVELAIELRADVTPNVHLESDRTGYSFLFVDFPPYGGEPEAPPAPDESPATEP